MKILVSDFDGTFYDDQFQENVKAINEFVEKGNIFIIATGRNVTSLKNEFEDIDLKYNYLICNDGGSIYDKDGNLLAYKKINPELVPKIYNYLDKNRKAVTEVFIDMGGEYSIDTDDQCITLIAKILDRKRAENVLADILTSMPEVNGYLSKNWINIVNKEVSKANAIEYLASKNNFNHEDIYTIGDDVNDVSMIKNYNGYMIDHYEEISKLTDKKVYSFLELVERLNESNNN